MHRTCRTIRAGLAIGLLALSSHGLEGFYKDVFMDGGAGLTARLKLPAADTLGLTWERVSTSSREKTVQIMAGDIADSNGHLLYPDKSPRFRMMYVNGGKAVNHSDSLGPLGRQRIIDFYNGGGSYSGSCAGAILTTYSTGTINLGNSADTYRNESYLHIYPSHTRYTNVNGSTTATDMLVPNGSPLLKYYDFGAEGRVNSINHNGGMFVIPNDPIYWVDGTEILATYAAPVIADSDYQNFLGQGSIWAYKTSASTGRMVLLGSHPEGAESGEKLHLFAGCLKYALEGLGAPRVKAELANGTPRAMDNNTKAGFEKIGDKQYHHFTITIPANTTSLILNLEGQAGYDFGLYAHKGSHAFASKTQFQSRVAGGKHQLVIPNPQEGTWYIGVELKTTVTTTLERWGQEYTGNLPVLNGISYTVKASYQRGTSSALDQQVGVGKGEFQLLKNHIGTSHRLEMDVPVAGKYEILLRSLTGQLLAEKQEYIPAGKSQLTLVLKGSEGSTVIGIIKGPKSSLLRRWTL